jgi:CubicO group peptidase (beta-lactamase class C family)
LDIPRRPDRRRKRRRRALAALAATVLIALPVCHAMRGPESSDALLPAPEPRPRTVGLDPARIGEAVARAETLPRLRALLVARHGEILVERHVRGPGLDSYANVKSVSKSLLSALVGIAIAEGHLEGPEQRVMPFFERHDPGDDPRRDRITIDHLLSMRGGLESTSGARYGPWVMNPHWVRYAITRPVVGEPGGRRIYSTGSSHLLSAILTDATGLSTWEFARSRLAEPLGIALPPWPRDPQGVYFGGNDMMITPRDLLRFGELYRNHGRHEGRQIIPESWVEASLQPRVALGWGGESYGYGWFLGRVRGHRMFYAWGYGGQFLFVVPDLELTVVVTSDQTTALDPGHARAVWSLVREWIVPAAEAGSAAAGVAAAP